MKRVLVVGFATRHVVGSARRAGYEVYAVDHFCDQDLCQDAERHLKFEELDEIPDLVSEICNGHTVDWLVTTSGAEELSVPIPHAGPSAECSARFLDKLEIQHFFEKNGIPTPALVDGRFPAMVKPRHGAGGWRNRVVRSAEELRAWEEEWPDVPAITQEVVGGVPASVSCVCDGKRAVALAVNEQLLRGGDGDRAYGFSGSVTPFVHPLAGRMMGIAEEAVARSGCVGSVGVDFVVGADDLRAIEINPRFQGTLDTVEASIGESVFRHHLDACTGRLPAARPAPCQVAARGILFADRDLVVKRDLSPLSSCIADIPWPGTEVEEGSAVVSVYGSGPDRAAALASLDRNITRVRQYMS
ncbi:ATP-grasp domain-containing protein [Methanofollis aquaemaris]|uniref:ATP-grasp domain-containing protein n=1 Tax=Methanofollis aquaemaris TaxID=126734 RepID=A0A8A3S327_9EURY|nr:ATP-grasp domain-containing protein [Methanofollis aquaemaris]QSZ66050.1 ATP-grasp domain-containing protein [Methanofollis aquaemaris]